MVGFEDFDVWKRAVELSAAIYLGTREIRDFGFRDQIHEGRIIHSVEHCRWFRACYTGRLDQVSRLC